MATPDGSITINTKIDESGINRGIKSVTNSLGGVLAPIKKIGKALSTAFLGGGNVFAIIKNLAKFAAAAFIGGSIINSIRGLANEFDLMSSSVGEKIKPLSDALATLKGAFVNLIVQAFIPMIPYIISAVHWLTNMLQTVTQIVAAFFGFKQTVGNILTKTAADAKKTAKETRGMLAAFDQLNVLQKETKAETPDAGPIATPPPITIPDDLLDKVKALRAELEEWFRDPIGKLQEAWSMLVQWFKANVFDPLAQWWKETWFGGVVTDLWNNMIETWGKIFDNVVETIAKIKENVIQWFRGLIEFIAGVFTGDWERAWNGLKMMVSAAFENLWLLITSTLTNIGTFIAGWGDALKIVFGPLFEVLGNVFDALKEKVAQLWQHIVDIWSTAVAWFQEHVLTPMREDFTGAFDWIKEKFATAFEAIKTIAKDVWESITGAWEGLREFFLNNVWLPIIGGFESMLQSVKQAFTSMLGGIQDFAKSVINTIIDYINGMIEGIVSGINTIIGAANAIGELTGLPEIGYIDAPKIPRLATGAVIPPNSEFLAVLGDQRGGRNLEAPEGLIRQIIREEIGNVRADIQIEFTGTLAALARELAPKIKQENVRIGGSLIKSGIT